MRRAWWCVPGFIDIQSHSIIPLMIDPRCLSKITQGVTTEIMGEAWTPAPAGGRVDHEIFPWDEHEICSGRGVRAYRAGPASATGSTP